MSTDLYVRGLRNLLVTEKKYSVALALISAALFVFLSINHAFYSMWVEGMPEYHHILLGMLGFIPVTPGCWINFHAIHIPLALNPYIGSAFFYFHLPTAYLWFNGYTSDPYIYRYMGIVMFLIDDWILFYTLLIYYKFSFSFYGVTVFLIV